MSSDAGVDFVDRGIGAGDACDCKGVPRTFSTSLTSVADNRLRLADAWARFRKLACEP